MIPLPVSDGRAELAVDLSPDLYGTLEMHAYKILASGSIVRDTRLVLVDSVDDLDLIIANDTARNFLFHNLGSGRFEEIGAFEGLAFDRNGKATGAMGIDAAQYRNDAELGIAIGNFANEMSSLFVTTDGGAPFADEAVLDGLGPASRLALTFGVLFFDYDLDGRLDLLQANGHLEHEINKVQASQQYAQPPQLFWNCGADCPASFLLVSEPGDLARPLVGRAAACADIDADGDLDVLATSDGDPGGMELIHVLQPRSSRQVAATFKTTDESGSTARLTRREEEVLQLMAEGTSTKVMAEALFIGEATVRHHVQSILRKLGAHSRLEAVAKYRRN